MCVCVYELCIPSIFTVNVKYVKVGMFAQQMHVSSPHDKMKREQWDTRALKNDSEEKKKMMCGMEV